MNCEVESRTYQRNFLGSAGSAEVSCAGAGVPWFVPLLGAGLGWSPQVLSLKRGWRDLGSNVRLKARLAHRLAWDGADGVGSQGHVAQSSR